MAIAAVPDYLGRSFQSASPGMRFGMYLPIWRTDWKKDKQLKWDQICRLGSADSELMQQLQTRQQALLAGYGDAAVFMLPAQSTAPFTTGLGNEHPTENGFAFLWPYGLPYLPGSGVKGVVRQAARELADGSWGEVPEWNKALTWSVKSGKDNIELSSMDVLFGKESKDGQTQHFHGVLAFLDVIPEIRSGKLAVDIMTPHQKHYYQDGQPPHDSGEPTPIVFLTVPPNSAFQFVITCDHARLARIAPELARNDQWKHMLQRAFEHAFDWLGFGAKTAVGYGAMQIDEAAQKARQALIQQQQEEAQKKQALKDATAGLSEDAAWMEKQRISGAWEDNGQFLNSVELFLDNLDATLSPEASNCLREELESRWKGISVNPDATHGKKNKPKYKPRPAELAKKLLAMEK